MINQKRYTEQNKKNHSYKRISRKWRSNDGRKVEIYHGIRVRVELRSFINLVTGSIYPLQDFPYRVVTYFRTITKYGSSGYYVWRMTHFDDLCVRLNRKGNPFNILSQRSRPQPSGRKEETETERVPIKKVGPYYEVPRGTIPSLFRGRSPGFHDQQVKLEWKRSNLCYSTLF